MYSLKVAPRHRPIFCICVSEYPASASAFAPPLRSECVFILVIGIPLFVGYWSSVAADLSARLMCSAVISIFSFFSQKVESSVFADPPWSRMWRKRRPSALTGHRYSSPLVSWYTHTPFHPFFWLSNFIVAPSAAAIKCAGASRERHRSCPAAFFLKKVISSYLN